MLEEHFVSTAEAARRTGQSEHTIRRWIERGKLQATKHGSTFQIALADLDHFIATRSPDVDTLLARVLALEELSDVQASQAQRLTELEHRAFLLENASPISNAHATAAHLLDERFPVLAYPLAWLLLLLLSSVYALSALPADSRPGAPSCFSIQPQIL